MQALHFRRNLKPTSANASSSEGLPPSFAITPDKRHLLLSQTGEAKCHMLKVPGNPKGGIALRSKKIL
jgi:hypothetical protein